MLKFGAWLIPALLILPLGAEESQVLPDLDTPPPPFDSELPVPPPGPLFGSPGAADLQMPKELKINNQSGKIEGNPETGMRLGGPVEIQGDNGLQTFSDTAVIDTKAKTVTLLGNVSVYQGNVMQRGDRAVYFYETKFLDSSGLRASLDPALLEAGKFTAERHGREQIYVGHDAGLTTDDVEDPNFWFRAKKIRIYPDDKIVFNNMRFYVGDVPVFWFPYLVRSLDPELGYHFLPGARSSWGAFLLNTYGIMLGGEKDPDTGENKDAWLLSRWHLDLRTSRGIGAGVDLVDRRIPNSKEIDGLSLYYLNDIAPETTRSGIPRGVVEEGRYKAEFKYRVTPDFEKDAKWRIDSNLSLLSDRYFLEDFDPARYRNDPDPDNTLGIYRRDEGALLSLYTRLRLNDFYRADTRLPEVAFDQARAPLFGLPLLHEGSTSLGIIGEKAADPTLGAVINPLSGLTLLDSAAQPLLRQLSGYERTLAEAMLALPPGDSRREALRSKLVDSSYARFRTYQEVSMPMTVGGFLSITPQAGIGYSRYDMLKGPDDGMDRTHLHAGAETSLKFSKDLGAVRNPEWGIDGMLHVLQPYATWSLVSTNDLESWDPGVDRLTPTTRPRPLDPARFTAVDDMRSWNVVRLGARNRLLTKRDGGTMEWLYVDTYMDTFIEDPEGQRNFSNLYNDIRWQPLPWLGVYVESQIPVTGGSGGYSDWNSMINFMPTKNIDIALGYRWLDGLPELPDSSHFYLQTYTRLSEKWGVSTLHSLELADSTMEYQQYTLHRDLGNWIAGIGLTFRDNRLQNEYGIAFSLTLKDFPSVSLPFTYNAE